MGEWPRGNFPPGAGSDSSGPHYSGNINFPGNSHSLPSMGMYRPPNFAPAYVPPDRPSGFPDAVTMHNSGGNFMPAAPPYQQPAPQWPSSGGPQCVAPNYHHLVSQPILPPESVGVFTIDTSVPPPLPPRFDALSTFQPQAPYLGTLVGDTSRQADAPRQQEEDDQAWIDSWIRQLPPRPASQPSVTRCPEGKVKVWKVKQSLQNCRVVLRELEVLERELGEGCEVMDEAEWNHKLEEAERKKVELMEKLGELDKGTLQRVKRALWKRGRKRARQRGRRALDRELVEGRAERRRQLHLEADMWLEGKQAQVDLQRREEMLKQEADGVLWEVRRKQSEGRRILSLLSALVKLYQVRVKKRDPDSNPALSENEDQFQNIIDKLSNLWERQMSEYESEERALRVMLTDSPGDSGHGTEAKSRAARAMGDLQRSLRQWETALFGTGGGVSEDLKDVGVDSCQWFYLQPSKSLDSLVENRRQWDQFISTSPSASAIPAGWVVPVEASSEEWKALTFAQGDCGRC
ncbi:programmed cell death protein 7-like [Ischnura elegans]|uniref:programmed cell death protein 7-like n=1 Tax=Ischnura elegans TaxID=197161 RepID=UPI001ED881E8|nr:programmed cell death protein 7-like [Ischnura elegans]